MKEQEIDLITILFQKVILLIKNINNINMNIINNQIMLQIYQFKVI
jgi:hypothetical protein